MVIPKEKIKNAFSQKIAEEIMSENDNETKIIEVIKEQMSTSIENVIESKKSKYTREYLFGLNAETQKKMIKDLGAEIPKKEWQRVELILSLYIEE